MNRRFISVLLACGLVAAYLLAVGAPGYAEVGVTDDTILVGATLPLSGPVAFLGAQGQTGVETYFSYINDKGGVHGRRLKYIAYDDAYAPPKSVANVKRLVDLDKVFAILSADGTPTGFAAWKYTTTKGVPFFAPYSQATLWDRPFKRDVFTLIPNYSVQAQLIVDYLVKRLKKKKVAVFYQDDAYGEDGLKAAAERLGKYGMKLSAAVSYKRGTSNYQPQAAKLARSGADSVLMVALHKSGSMVIHESVKIGYRPTWIGMNPMANRQLIRLGKGDVEGFVGLMTYPFPEGDAPALVRYRQRLKKYAPSYKPDNFSLASYTAAMIFVEVLQRAGRNLTRETFINAGETLKNYASGIISPLSYSSKSHSGVKTAFFAKIIGGKWQKVTDLIELRN